MTFPNRAISEKRRRGFTLLEVAITLTLIGLLGVMALPGIRRAVMRAQITAMANDLRVFGEAYSLHHGEGQDWPATADPGVPPSGMSGELSAVWSRPTPIGGLYRWVAGGEYRGNTTQAAIEVVATDGHPLMTNYEQLVQLDRLFDDGNLLTGALQVSVYPQIVYILE